MVGSDLLANGRPAASAIRRTRGMLLRKGIHKPASQESLLEPSISALLSETIAHCQAAQEPGMKVCRLPGHPFQIQGDVLHLLLKHFSFYCRP